MKWNTPKFNDSRIKKKFAWLPVKVEGRVTVWLEFYYVMEIYRDEDCLGDQGWNVKTRWV